MLATTAELLRWAYLGWRLAAIWIPTAQALSKRLKTYPYGKLNAADRAFITRALDRAIEQSCLSADRPINNTPPD